MSKKPLPKSTQEDLTAKEETLAEVADDTALAKALAKAALRNASPILTIEEAMELAKAESYKALRNWCARWGVKTVTRGRYNRQQIFRALQREARGTRA